MPKYGRRELSLSAVGTWAGPGVREVAGEGPQRGNLCIIIITKCGF